MELKELKDKAGIAKILEKGTEDPDAVRYHVPNAEGGWDQITWGEVLRRSREIALYLDQQGVKKDTKVSIFALTRLEWAFCIPGIEACRGVFVPVYFSNTPDQTHYVVDHSDAEILFTEMALFPRVLERWRDYTKVRRVILWDLADEKQLEETILEVNKRCEGLDLTLDEVREKVTSLQEVYVIGARRHEAEPDKLPQLLEQVEESDVSAIYYTSGTTGDPKGVVLTIRNLIASTRSWYTVLEHAFPPKGERRDILWLPISHMSGSGIMGQGTMFEYETWFSDPLHLLQIIPEVKPTMLLCVPAYWEKMYSVALNSSTDKEEQYAKLRELTGGKLTFLLSGGAGLKREVKDFFYAAGIQMIEGYGLTECAPNLTMNRLDDFDFDSIGKPMPGVTMQLADDGEILVKGENVFSGYYKDEAATEEVFDDEGWFHTGDLGEWTDRGFVKFKGRKKEIIVTSGGKNISPAGIEAMFVGNPFIENVVVYGDEHKYLVAMITLNELVMNAYAKQNNISYTDLTDLIHLPQVRELVEKQVEVVNGSLASYETIKKWYLHDGHLSVEAGHLTPSLKLRRAKVWEAFGDRLEALY